MPEIILKPLWNEDKSPVLRPVRFSAVIHYGVSFRDKHIQMFR